MNRIQKQVQACRLAALIAGNPAFASVTSVKGPIEDVPVNHAAAPQVLELPLDDSQEEDALFASDDHDRREMLLADAWADAEELERLDGYTLARSDAALLESADDELINLKPILDYLEHARLHAVQKPAIRIAFAGHEAILKARSLGWGGEPAVYVLDKTHGADTYWGKITPDGFWHYRGEPPAWLREVLRRTAEAPEAVAIAYGKETGVCGFCGHVLTDPVSRQRGYGPICAKWLRKGSTTQSAGVGLVQTWLRLGRTAPQAPVVGHGASLTPNQTAELL